MQRLCARFRVERPDFHLDVDLDLPGCGVSAVFGHSGAGKSTLLRCLAGLERAPGGYLRVDGEVWQDAAYWLPPHRRPLGYVFQDANLFTHLRVRGNLAYGARRAGADARHLTQAIELLGIAPLLDRRTDDLSGGERQRVAIARALATAPRLLLLDEPLAALDPARKREVLPYLERLHGELRIPVLYVSHAIDEIARIADHLLVLENGRVVAAGALADVLARIDLARSFGDEDGALLAAEVVAIDAQWHLARLAFPGGELWIRDHGLAPGQRVRVRILASDVSLCREPPVASSIQNAWPAHIDALADDPHPAMLRVRLRVGDSHLLAAVTRRAGAELALAPGQSVWVQVKSAAVLE